MGQKIKLLYCGFVTSSIMDQFKEIPLLESLLNFQKCDLNLDPMTFIYELGPYPADQE